MADAKALKRTRFTDVFNTIRDEVLEYVKAQNVPADALEWFHRSLDYNVPGGKLNRGLSVVDSVEILKGRALTDEEYFKSAVLGWCVELLQAFFLVSDDLMDSSITRRDQPCWYRTEGVNLISVNDAFMLEAAIYYLLKKHFRQEPAYVNLLELFLETTFQTEIGQLMDLITAPEDHVDLNKFSLEKHRLIVVYKTAFYSFYLPVALAMYYCDIPHTHPTLPTVDPYKLASSILIPLGEYFQIQDDFLDFSGTPEQIGKIGTDIVDNKCSWVINTALSLASPAQRAILDENYGRKNPEAEKRVKEVFYAVDVPGKYYKYEEDAYKRINGLIESIPVEGLGAEGQVKLQREVFTSFLNKIYKRQK
ncbi:farnesyl-diphosphate synthase [Irpex rosettiformis]|uniref:Farnesyl-diphosphate synthase n=1 Tax=Irpex rosettiformis TaxID=378272 RepID=A0ACB8TMK4_9APHY|nr:farnesyl-diphosphate synthase [Irpex rosettiformis]